MAKTSSNEELGERIERLVQEHIEASRRAAQEAVQRAFAAAVTRPTRTTTPTAERARRGGKRRPPHEIAALSEQLYEAVCAKPGETMSVLGAGVGLSARELHRPMALLKRSGRVRSVGTRHLTRYFPMMNGTSASAWCLITRPRRHQRATASWRLDRSRR